MKRLFSSPKTKVSFYTRYILHLVNCAKAGLVINYNELDYQIALDVERASILLRQRERDERDKYLLESIQQMLNNHAKSIASIFK